VLRSADNRTVNTYSSLSLSLPDRVRSDDRFLSLEWERLLRERDLRWWLRDLERLFEEELEERRLRDLSTHNNNIQLHPTSHMVHMLSNKDVL